ncbi:ankyrin repeat-containing domain protein [Colletotrichum lupini]|nr:ankyrin repeat-containing domain protein [Colletotrichum lupini]
MLLKKIIAEARDIERMPERLATELGLACEQGHLEVIELLLSYMPDINVEGRDGLPLALACSAGRENAVRKLLDRGGDVNFAVRLCEAPLSAACRSGNKDIVELLLRKGADPTIQTLFNPMAQAASNGHTHIVKILLSHEKRRSKSRSVAEFAKNALHDACFYGESGIVKLLLQEGADINLQGGHEGSPLHAACSQGHMKTVCVLLENRANIDLERNGETALGVACARGHYAVAELLLARGASIKAPIRRSGMVYERPLERAYKAGNTSIVKLLLARGALIDFTVDTETRNTEVALLLLPTWRPAQPRLVDSSLFAFRRKPFEVGVPKKKPVAPHRAVKKLPDCGCLICWMDAYVDPRQFPRTRPIDAVSRRVLPHPTFDRGVTRTTPMTRIIPTGQEVRGPPRLAYRKVAADPASEQRLSEMLSASGPRIGAHEIPGPSQARTTIQQGTSNDVVSTINERTTAEHYSTHDQRLPFYQSSDRKTLSGPSTIQVPNRPLHSTHSSNANKPLTMSEQQSSTSQRHRGLEQESVKQQPSKRIGSLQKLFGKKDKDR